MKKIISLILVLAVCLSLCACSKKCDCGCEYCCGENVGNTNEISTHSQMEPEENVTNDDRIEFSEPVLLAESEEISIELVAFFQEDDDNNGVKDKYISLKFHNKADYEIGIHLMHLSVDGEAVDCTYHKAQTPKLLPGESVTQFFKIHYAFGDTLNTMEDLYEFKGRFQLHKITGISTGEYGDEIPFSVEDALNGVVGKPIEY